MGSRPQPSEQQLQDYVDGRLDSAREAEVAAYLAEHPESAARVERYRSHVAGMHALYDGVLSEPIPPGMRALLQRASARRRRPRWALAAAALSTAVIVGAALLRWGAGERVEGELAAAQEAHLHFAALSSWDSDVAELHDDSVARMLAERFGAPVSLPDAAHAGFALKAVRLLPPGSAALLLYRDAAGHTASLYVAAGPSGDKRGDSAAADVHTFFRSAHGVFYALTVPAAESDEPLRRAFATTP